MIVGTLADLKKWTDSHLHQGYGSQTEICQETGEKYTVIFEHRLCRPGDEAVIEADLVRSLHLQLADYIGLPGFIFWRQQLEYETTNTSTVIEYKDDGPDYDPITDRRCVKDHNWRIIRAYCRFSFQPMTAQ